MPAGEITDAVRRTLAYYDLGGLGSLYTLNNDERRPAEAAPLPTERHTHVSI